MSPVGAQFLKVSQNQSTTFHLILKLSMDIWGLDLHYFASVSFKTSLVGK